MTGSDRSRLHPPSENSAIAQSVQPAVGREPCGVFRKVWMALPRDGHVELARQPDAHGASCLVRAKRRDRRIRVGLHFLPAERSTHSQALDRHMITRDAKHARDDLLRFGRMLRRGVDGDESCLIYPRERRLGFEIEMLLAADPQLALDTSGLASIAAVSPSTIRS